MTAYTVIWNGTMHRQDEANCSLLGDMAFRSNALLDAAPQKTKSEVKRAVRRRQYANCACGKPIAGSGHKRCWDCRMIDPQPFPKCHCGRAIRSPGKDRCGKCRERSSYRGRYKVRAA